mmetsp:Transcript_20951/g.31618  ORF Transcript_20951/g.31618 Transcript_20951/m.31618 type:complete len:360 (+) Transcript_20951:83-1162(+)
MDIQYASHSNILHQTGFWQSCFAAFGIAPLIRPPPMICHYYRDLLSKPSSSGSAFFAVNKINDKSAADFIETIPHVDLTSQPRIAIVGGGIAGVTAANALCKKLSSNNVTAKIVIFEGDEYGSNNEVDFSNHQQPSWLAATARNANTICPGASFHVMSQRNTLIKIMKDTVREWYEERQEMLQNWLQKENLAADHLLRLDNFDYPPPYFALHLFRCVGPSASWDERATFLTFLTSFLKTSLFSTEHDVHERGELIYQLAKSNRVLFLGAMNDSSVLASKTGLSRGFISLYRSKQDAIHDFQEGESFGEDFALLSYEDVSENACQDLYSMLTSFSRLFYLTCVFFLPGRQTGATHQKSTD